MHAAYAPFLIIHRAFSLNRSHKSKVMVQTFTIVFTCGTNDPVKVHAGVVAGFAQRKIGNKVNFVLMAEAGCKLDQPTAATFKTKVLSGDWAAAVKSKSGN